jgi:hypothetical protein
MSNCCDSGTCPKCAETRKRFAKLAGAYLAKNKPTYEQLTAENSRLRKAIEGAPHAQFCETELINFRTEQSRRENIKGCTCWKRNALEGEE